jgi:hypothetical protein
MAKTIVPYPLHLLVYGVYLEPLIHYLVASVAAVRDDWFGIDYLVHATSFTLLP